MKELGKHALESPGDPKKKVRTKKGGDDTAFACWIEEQVEFVKEACVPKTGIYLNF